MCSPAAGEPGSQVSALGNAVIKAPTQIPLLFASSSLSLSLVLNNLLPSHFGLVL